MCLDDQRAALGDHGWRNRKNLRLRNVDLVKCPDTRRLRIHPRSIRPLRHHHRPVPPCFSQRGGTPHPVVGAWNGLPGDQRLLANVTGGKLDGRLQLCLISHCQPGQHYHEGGAAGGPRLGRFHGKRVGGYGQADGFQTREPSSTTMIANAWARLQNFQKTMPGSQAHHQTAHPSSRIICPLSPRTRKFAPPFLMRDVPAVFPRGFKLRPGSVRPRDCTIMPSRDHRHQHNAGTPRLASGTGHTLGDSRPWEPQWRWSSTAIGSGRILGLTVHDKLNPSFGP